MKVFTSVASVFFVFASYAPAQEPNRSRGQGYVFFAFGPGNIGPEFGPEAHPLDIHVGAGGEGFISNGLAVGAELGPLGPTKSGSAFLGWSDWVVGLGSANLSYHFLPSTIDRKLEPFVTAGYSLFFRHGTFSGSNFGGGVNVWMNKDVALRFEGRFHSAYYHHFIGFRIGVTFR